MLVREDGHVWGSVSGGCVETSVVQAALGCLETGRHALLEYGPASADAVWDVGLSCGGGIRVLVAPCPAQSSTRSEWDVWAQAREWTASRTPYVWTTDVSGQEPVHTVRLLDGSESSLTTHWDEAVQVFVDVRRPAERLIIVGGAHIAVPLVSFARTLGFETVVVEPRATFAVSSRFDVPPDAIETDWPDVAVGNLRPDASTYAVAVTHDPKIDDPALIALLRSEAAYIGVLGGRTTHAERLERLRSAGFGDVDLARLKGPVGLQIGAETPEEIALSIMAEIVQVRRG